MNVQIASKVLILITPLKMKKMLLIVCKSTHFLPMNIHLTFILMPLKWTKVDYASCNVNFWTVHWELEGTSYDARFLGQFEFSNFPICFPRRKVRENLNCPKIHAYQCLSVISTQPTVKYVNKPVLLSILNINLNLLTWFVKKIRITFEGVMSWFKNVGLMKFLMVLM